MKILIEESVLRQALEALELMRRRPDICKELNVALDAAEKVEPVAWYADHRVEDEVEIEWNKNKPTSAASWKPLFSYPESNGYSIGVIDSNGDIYPEPPPAGTVLYTHPAPAVPEDVKHLRDLLGKANALCRIRQGRIKELVSCIERMRVAGGSHEFQMAFELAKDAIGHGKDTTLTDMPEEKS